MFLKWIKNVNETGFVTKKSLTGKKYNINEW